LLIIIGVLDDKYSLSAGIRIAAQVAVVLIMFYGSGFQLVDIGDPFGFGVITLGPFSLIFTTIVSLTVINAYNFVDGADGLAGCLSLVALLSVSLVGGYTDPSTAIALTVSAAVVGFLVFNFPVTWNRPVRTFMGDAGSTFLGFTILWVVLGASQGADRLVSPVVGLWFAAIPIYDCLTCFVRRTWAGKSPFKPGRDHFHHILNRRSFPPHFEPWRTAGSPYNRYSYRNANYLCGNRTRWTLLGCARRAHVRRVVSFGPHAVHDHSKNCRLQALVPTAQKGQSSGCRWFRLLRRANRRAAKLGSHHIS
jgi:UDP-N-acetylmuramyl pentapeptide phosphotransferase/UDP-N-acetylglucosamine-1-phosphate transferase